MKYCIAFCLLLLTTFALSQTEQGLNVNDQAPIFEAKNQFGKTVNSSNILPDSNIVLIFYRGKWCPYCKKHLSTLQDSIELINQKGGKLIVVSPERPESSLKTIDKTGATYDVLYDSTYSIMKSFKVDYKISKETVTKYRFFVKKLTRKSNGNEDDILPIPATYVIDKTGKIVFKHYDKDYTKRSSVKDILNHL